MADAPLGARRDSWELFQDFARIPRTKRERVSAKWLIPPDKSGCYGMRVNRTKDTDMNRYYISATFDLAIPEDHNGYIEIDGGYEIGESLAQAVGGIGAFGDGSTVGGTAANYIARDIPVTIEQLEALEEELSALALSRSSRVPQLSECILYDPEEGSYTSISQWADELIEVFESELQQAASNGPLGEWVDLEGEWLLYTPLGVVLTYRRAVRSMIENLKYPRVY